MHVEVTHTLNRRRIRHISGYEPFPKYFAYLHSDNNYTNFPIQILNTKAIRPLVVCRRLKNKGSHDVNNFSLLNVMYSRHM